MLYSKVQLFRNLWIKTAYFNSLLQCELVLLSILMAY